ncbi:MAG: hypothetical protein JWM77_4210 [Rhodospirillales bacterium]|jgi:hypothetical protein|nr:hypothetical protein [Rhodospirillales bacterium]
MRRWVLFAALTASLTAMAARGGAAERAPGDAAGDAVERELRAYDQLLQPTADALAAVHCDTRECVPALLTAMRGHDRAMRHGVQTIQMECARLDAGARQRCAEGVQRRFDELDRANTERLKNIVERYGWPSTRNFGEAAEQAAWLIALHADLDRPFQHRVLTLLEASTEQGESPPRHLAYLYDRVAVADHKPQRWGTQGRCVAEKWEPFPIEDPAGVDRRRAAAGMAPMAAYRTSFDPAGCAGKN